MTNEIIQRIDFLSNMKNNSYIKCDKILYLKPLSNDYKLFSIKI